MATNTFTSLPPLTIDSLKRSMELLRDLTPPASHVVAHPSVPLFAKANGEPVSNQSVFSELVAFGSVKVICSPLMTMTKQTRLPRSKKRRIRRKWAKKYTQTVPSDKVLIFSQEAMRRAMDRTMSEFWGL